MKKMRMRYIFFVCALLIAMLLGCAPSGTEESSKYMEPAYPPYYDIVYEQLLGTDLNTVLDGLGLTQDDFIVVVDSLSNTPLCYRSTETVPYLGEDFFLELRFLDMENATLLYQVACYTELTGSAEEKANVVEALGETLQKMFGYTPAGEHIENNGFKNYDPAELAQKFSDNKDWLHSTVWRLTTEVSHIPDDVYIANHGPEDLSFNLTYQVGFFPDETSCWVRIFYQVGVKAGNHLVR